jgi:hypothetical protein
LIPFFVVWRRVHFLRCGLSASSPARVSCALPCCFRRNGRSIFFNRSTVSNRFFALTATFLLDSFCSSFLRLAKNCCSRSVSCTLPSRMLSIISQIALSTGDGSASTSLWLIWLRERYKNRSMYSKALIMTCLFDKNNIYRISRTKHNMLFIGENPGTHPKRIRRARLQVQEQIAIRPAARHLTHGIL